MINSSSSFHYGAPGQRCYSRRNWNYKIEINRISLLVSNMLMSQPVIHLIIFSLIFYVLNNFNDTSVLLHCRIIFRAELGISGKFNLAIWI